MRRTFTIVTALVLLGGTVGIWHANRPDTSCPTTTMFRGVSYTEVEVEDEVQSRDDVGVATERGCGYQGPYSREVGFSRIAGVEPTMAVVTPTSARVIYIADAYTVGDLPSEIQSLAIQY